MRSTTMTVCRLLLVCVFCTLWGGAVTAGVKATPTAGVNEVAQVVKEAQETTQNIMNELKMAEYYANKQAEIENEPLVGNDFTPYTTKTASNGQNLSQAVKKATNAAGVMVAAVQAVEQTLTEGELKELMTSAVQKAKIFLTALSKADSKAQEINEFIQKFHDPNNGHLILDQMNNLLPLLGEATNAANSADQFFQEAVKNVSAFKGDLQEDPKDSSTSSAQTQNGAMSSESGMGETQHTDALHDAEVQFSSWPRSNNPFTADPRKTMPCERMTISDDLHDDNGTDRAHDGAVTAWAPSSLLLLLTAVAYAAVC